MEFQLFADVLPATRNKTAHGQQCRKIPGYDGTAMHSGKCNARDNELLSSEQTLNPEYINSDAVLNVPAAKAA